MLDYQESVELRSSLGMNDEVYFKYLWDMVGQGLEGRLTRVSAVPTTAEVSLG